jgi:vacuolar-type H+-ATPase subunit D/Vma8
VNFDNIYQLLLWFFKKSWISPPKMPGNHDLNKIRWSRTAGSIKEVWDAAQKVKEILAKMPPKDVELIRLLFTEKTTDELACERNLTERRVRQIRYQIIETLKAKCQDVGLLGREVGVEEPVMVRQ